MGPVWRPPPTIPKKTQTWKSLISSLPGLGSCQKFRESALFSLRPGLRSPGQDSALGSGTQRPRQRKDEA